MVKAILGLIKKSTRRPVKGCIPDDATWGYTMFTPKNHISCRGTFDGEYGEKFFKLPYKKGDILYVRETWTSCKIQRPEKAIPADYKDIKYLYKADDIKNSDGSTIKWHPSIHMSKDAARIFLMVTDIKVQRLQDITEDEARAEGVRPDAKELFTEKQLGYTKGFKFIWNKLYANWSDNPWVWVIEFQKI